MIIKIIPITIRYLNNNIKNVKYKTFHDLKSDANGHTAHLNIQLWLNSELSISVDLCCYDNQLKIVIWTEQNMHGLQRTTPETFL